MLWSVTLVLVGSKFHVIYQNLWHSNVTKIIGIQKEVTFRCAQNITKERATKEELRTSERVFHEVN